MKALLAFATVVAAIAATAPATPAGTPLGGGARQGYNPNAYVYGGASVAVAKAIQTAGTESYDPHAHVYGGASAGAASAIQVAGKETTNTAAAPLSSQPNKGGSFSWGDAGIGVAAWTGVLLVLLGGSLIVLRRRGALAH